MADLSGLRERLEAVAEQLLIRDAARLHGQLQRARGKRFDTARFERDLQQAQLRADNRQRLRPSVIEFPDELPVVQSRAELEQAIREHQVIVVCGETGSGKTTQLPKLCLELGRGRRGLIGHTQPRRLAARSVAQRIATELQGPLGGLVGYETRFDRRVGEQTLVKLMTDGILLAELTHDRLLRAYDTIIIDEAHERSLNIDFLLGWLKQILPQRPELKVIVTSATLDPERLSNHFGGAPIIEVSGRTYPVETHYRPPTDEIDTERAIADAVGELWHPRPQGDILVFLPGEREIRDAARVLAGRFPQAEVLPLYSRLAATAQDLVFSPGKAPRIVLATNVAETSLTVPGIRYVIDTGTARINRYAPRTGVQLLQIEPVSQAAANQRAGRCGRLGPGICIRLYDADDFAARPLFTDPEIRRANLAGVMLQMATLDLGRIDHFHWVDPPDGRHVAEATRVLTILGAFTDNGDLTSLGRKLGRLPLDPRIARIALAGQGSAAADMVYVLAAALSIQDPHEVPADAQDAARQKHAQWRHKRSDFLTLLQLWQRWCRWSAEHSNRQLRRTCRDHYVSFLRMEEWEAVYGQIRGLLDAPLSREERRNPTADWTPEQLESLYAPIHQALLAGLIDHIGQKLPEAPEFQGPKGRRFRLHPGSALQKKPPAWVMSAQLAQTTRLYARTNAAVEPAWLEQVGAHLIKRALLHPTWSPERGEVSSTEHITLLGLPLATRRRHYGSTHPAEAREIFIREALVGGQMPRKPAFLQHNLAVIQELRDKEIRLRRPDLLADDAHFEAWYAERLPLDLCTTVGLKRWLHAHKGAAQRLSLQEADALRPGASADVSDLFPDQLEIGDVRIPLSYHHDPGADHDGVTFHIPLAQVHALPPEPFDWLVPGLRTGLIEALIRSLPNKQRRAFTPAAAFAEAAAGRLEPAGGAVLERLATALQAMTGAPVEATDFQPDKLDAHLRPRFQLEATDGRVLGTGDTLQALQQRHGKAARQALQSAAAQDGALQAWTRDLVEDWDFGDLPAQIRLPTGAPVYPALMRRPDGRAGLALFESREAADHNHHAGSRALLLARMADRTRDLRKSVRSRLGLLAAAFALDPDEVTLALAEHSADRILLPKPMRTRDDFQAALERRGAFSIDAQQRLDDLLLWLDRARTLRAKLNTLGNQWPDSQADIRTQLDGLLSEGFLREIPETQWARVTQYLRGIEIRLERLTNKPARDADLTREIAPLAQRLPSPFHPARWVLEEWRITLFAQELRAQGAPTRARVEAALSA